MGRLLEHLENFHLGDLERDDERIWFLDEEKGFSVKSMYEALCIPAPISFSSKVHLEPQIPSEISSFMWELWWDQAPTIDNLIAKGMVIPNWCCICISEGDSLGHLFIHCPRATSL